VPLTVRKATPGRSLRITWEDGSNVEVGLTAKAATKDGNARSSVAVQHGRLASRERAQELKAFWAARLDALAAHLAAGGPG
jgi:uncharacterized protein YndB with AHSA1/START domain